MTTTPKSIDTGAKSVSFCGGESSAAANGLPHGWAMFPRLAGHPWPTVCGVMLQRSGAQEIEAKRATGVEIAKGAK